MGYFDSVDKTQSVSAVLPRNTLELTEAFFLHGAWRLILDGVVVPADFNSKGAAEAAIPVERNRRARKLVR